MSYTQIFNIAAAGMDIEKARFDVAAYNLSNQHTTRTADGTPFIPHQVVANASSFETMIDGNLETMPAQINVQEQHLAANKVYQPGHPEADKQGYVSYPGISSVDETITMLTATRAFEANIKIMNMARAMVLQALTIGEER